ncbi:hypothetical protein G0Q01_22245 [Yangia sp. PrR007]|nr:hypothetical protein [Salipiger sp. PrR007]
MSKTTTRAPTRRACAIKNAVPSVLPEPGRPSTSVWPPEGSAVRDPGSWKLKRYWQEDTEGRTVMVSPQGDWCLSRPGAPAWKAAKSAKLVEVVSAARCR